MSAMSADGGRTAFARAVAEALLRELSDPRRAGRRYLLRGLFGLSPEAVFRELLDGRSITTVEVYPDGPDAAAAQIDAIDAGTGTKIIPYLVADSIGPSLTNSGGGGYAASLRTHFQEQAAGDRVLLILAARPQETIASTTDDAATLPGLSFDRLCRAAALPGPDEPQPARLIRDIADDYIGRVRDLPAVSWAEVELLRGWAAEHHDSTDSAIGKSAYELRWYISDPDLSPVTAGRRLKLSAEWRANLDQWINSPGTDLARKLSSKRVAQLGLDAVLNAQTVRGLDYSRFSLADLQSRGARKPALLDGVNPVPAGAQLTIQKDSALAIWAPAAGGTVEFRMTRRLERNEQAKLRWRDEPAIILEARGNAAFASIAPPGPDAWRFGWIELTEAGAITARYPIAVAFNDGSLFAVEEGLDIDPARGGFNCGETPVIAIWNRNGRELGTAVLDEASDDSDELPLMVCGELDGARVGPVPVLPTQPSADDDGTEASDDTGDEDESDGTATGGTGAAPEKGTPPDGPEGERPPEADEDDDLLRGISAGRGEYPAASPEQPTLAHAMRAFQEPTWPSEPSVPAPGTVSARFGSIALRVRPAADGFELLPAERMILQHPEWCMFEVGDGTCTPLREFPRPGPGWAQELTAFTKARTEYFAAALQAGSTYALDPRTATARQYTAAYRQLLDALPRDGASRAEYDDLLLVDRTTVRGIADLFFAPTSPITVSWHAALTDRFAALAESAGEADRADVSAFTPQHLVPLIFADSSWYEARPSPGALLWRRYVLMASSIPGALERNAAFMAERIAFFLSVNPNLNKPETTLAVTFAEPGDGMSAIDALRRFFEHDSAAAKYRRPRVRATLTGATREARTALNTVLSGATGSDVDRIVRTRAELVVTEKTDPPAFSSVAFMFRSPGSRGVRPIPLSARASTSYARGLAASLGRVVVPEAAHVFATGTFCAQPAADATDLEAIQYRSLELVGGQGGERLQTGWTRMVAATASEDELSRWYDQSAWVVHLDRLIGLEAFSDAGSARTLLEYEEGADPSSFGYDGITGTRYVEPYLAALRRSLAGIATPDPDGARNLMRLLEAVSGRWALQIVQRPVLKIRERAGTACAIRYLAETERILDSPPGSFTALVALEEIVPGFPAAGIPRRLIDSRQGRGPMCDDLLVLCVQTRDNAAPLIQATVVEVKFWQEGGTDYSSAGDQVEETISWLSKRFNEPGPFADLRGRDLAELIRSASTRNSTFKLAPALSPGAEDALQRISEGDYELTFGLWRNGSYRRGIVTAIEHRLPGTIELSQLNASHGPIDLVSVRHDITQPALEMKPLPSPAGWVKLTLQPPAGDSQPAQEHSPRPASQPNTTSASDAPAQPPAGPATQASHPANGTPATDEVRRYSRRLDEAFARYGLTIEPFNPALAQIGPSVIRFRTRAIGRLSITDVERRSRDISREVGAHGQVSVGDAPGFITVDVPREDPEPVPLATALAALDSTPHSPGALPFVAGIAPSGDARIADLSSLPHLLVAGATGSGKSVFLRGLLVELLRARTSNELRLMIIDPKRLDFAPFAKVPHLEGGTIISDPAEALQRLQSTLDREIDRRTPILAEAGVSSSEEFYEAGGLLTDLPQLVILVDEFADLVLAGHDRRGFSELVQRYAQLTRAFGIFLVLSTQRPSVDVITGSIKANLSARIAFSLPSVRDSMTILDQGGAEDLLGNGDLLFYRNGKIERLQAPMTTLADVRKALL